MAKLTWLGEDELHYGAAGPSFTTAFGDIKFPKGEPVEVSDEDTIKRARRHPQFKVSANVEPAAEADDGGLVGDPRFPAPVKRKPGRPRKDETADVED